MLASALPTLRSWVDQFAAHKAFDDCDREAFATTPVVIRDLAAGQNVSLQGEEATSICIVLEGLLCSYEIVAHGARQIQAYQLAGSIPDLLAYQFGVNSSSLVALRPSKVAFMTHARLAQLLADRPRISECVWRKAMVDASVARSWLSNVGRRQARARIAHLICELFCRYREMGLAETALPVSITQTELGDSQGRSAVHVNRVMQNLKCAGLIRMTGSHICISDWERLVDAGDFDPGYLHLRTVH